MTARLIGSRTLSVLFALLWVSGVGLGDDSSDSGQEVIEPRSEVQVSAVAATAGDSPSRQTPERRFLAPDGESVSFHSHAEAVEFLLQAEVISTSNIPVGVTKPLKLLLERDGKQAHAVFHHIDEQKPRARTTGGATIRNFLDSYRSQVAAYELSRLLGMESVPPTIERRVGKQTGSVQLWLEDVITEKMRVQGKSKPSDAEYNRQQIADRNIFHNLINNTDPNQGNILWDKSENIWLIDHTRSFSRNDDLLRPQSVRRCSNRLWKGLNELNLELLTEKLSPYIDKWEIRTLENRRQRILSILSQRIADHGQEEVLFTYGDHFVAIEAKVSR